MITTLVLTLTYSLLNLLLSVLPVGATLPAGISNALAFMIYSANALDYVIPVGSLFGALSIVLGVEIVLWSFHGFMWVYRHIPLIGH